MASGSVVALEFIVDLCWSIKDLFKAVCPYQRRRTVHFIEIQYLLWYVYICVFVVKLLRNEFFAEYGGKLLSGHRLVCGRIEQRCRLILHISADIVPLLRHFILIQIGFVRNVLFHFKAPFFYSTFTVLC